MPGYLRRATGPGWALVGDAGYFKDPLTAHGITDALRDAEFLTRAVVDGGQDALDEYERTRDRLSLPLLDVAESIAAYQWDLRGDPRAAARRERSHETRDRGAPRARHTRLGRGRLTWTASGSSPPDRGGRATVPG
jgi:flavin-dependent dehydrogenase